MFMNPVKKSLRMSTTVVVSGLLLLATPAALAAQTSTSPNSASSTPTTSDTTKTEKTTDEPAAKLTDRLAKYKTRHVVKLLAAEETKLKGVCKAAQVKLKVTDTKTGTANDGRTKIYTGIVKQLDTITSRLKDAEVDTTELVAARKQLHALIDQYNSDYQGYKTELNDLSEMDCVTDPTAFKAALLSTRADRVTMVSDAKDIHDYISTVKDALTKAKQALATTKPAVSDVSTEGGDQ
jgi:hypothetical protein